MITINITIKEIEIDKMRVEVKSETIDASDFEFLVANKTLELIKLASPPGSSVSELIVDL